MTRWGKWIAITPLVFMMTVAASAHAGKPKPKIVWSENNSSLVLFGDMRFRHETDSEEHDGKAERNRDRDRLRLRLGLTYNLNEVVSVGARLATEADDDHSTNHNFGIIKGGAAESAFGLDKAFIKINLTPAWLWMGKNSNHTWDVTHLTWDPDLIPEGIAMGAEFGDVYKTNIFAGYYLLNETGYDDMDDTMLAYQATFEYARNYSIKVAVGGYALNDRAPTEGEDPFPVPGGTASYNHAMVELGGKDLPLSPVIGAQFVSSNVDIEKHIGDGGKDSDRQATVVYVKVKREPVTVMFSVWDVGYAGDTALGEFNADEFAKTGNFTGWILSVKGEVYEDFSIEAKYFQQEVKNDAINPPFAGDAQLGKGNKRTRTQLNFVVKF
ncbi:MAG: putative porin [Nitrospinota bacterium]|nr:putative porin [Nitrospinota bacterium]